MSASSPPPTRIWRIAGEHDGYRKIITTPEGFDKKVLPAMHELEIPVYKDYFLLFDECEKVIQDVGYRGDIYLPVEDFFKFENKAMVSATPIVPSDPRFEENGFKILKLVPTYDSRIELTLSALFRSLHCKSLLKSRYSHRRTEFGEGVVGAHRRFRR